MTSATPHERRARILEKIAMLQSLPSLPQVVTEILRLLAEDRFSAQELMELIQQDPSLTARVLKLANSATYGRVRQVATLDRALVLLGANEVQRLVTTISVMRSFASSFQSGNLDSEAFWSHALTTAEVAQKLSASFELQLGGAEFTAGLLHDVGMIILDQHFHNEFSDCLQLARTRRQSLYLVERELLGIDHAEVGGLLAERWQLPEALLAGIRLHHEKIIDPQYADMAACIRMANLLAGGEERTREELQISIAQGYEPAWTVLQKRRPQGAVLEDLGDHVDTVRQRVHVMVKHLC